MKSDRPDPKPRRSSLRVARSSDSSTPTDLDPRTTERASAYSNFDRLSLRSMLRIMNREDRIVPRSVAKALPQVEALSEAIYRQMHAGGRLFYLGAGTSGRLGIVDASECPPTFGVEPGRVIGLIAGGDAAIRKAVEFAEDQIDGGWNDLQAHQVGAADMVVGLAASGTTPYVVGALAECRRRNIPTGCITCNHNTPLEAQADYPVVVLVGPEVISGSTRLKSGTAQKLVLNMLTTTVMVRLGYVRGNRMVHMQLSNHKLWDRGIRMLQQEYPITEAEARRLLKMHGSVDAVMRQLESAPMPGQPMRQPKESPSPGPVPPQTPSQPPSPPPSTSSFDTDAPH